MKEVVVEQSVPDPLLSLLNRGYEVLFHLYQGNSMISVVARRSGYSAWGHGLTAEEALEDCIINVGEREALWRLSAKDF